MALAPRPSSLLRLAQHSPEINSRADMLTQIVAGRVYDYSHVVGRYLGPPGFNCPVKMAIGESHVVYVLNRGYGRSCHVAKITVGLVPGDEEYLAEFSKFGNADGDLTWPVGLALDSQENLYVTDEWLNQVSSFDKEGNLLSVWGAEVYPRRRVRSPVR